MGMLRFPLVAELCDRAILAVGDEDRVEAEAFRPARLVGDPSGQRAGTAELVALRRQRDELADGARAASVALDPLELAQQPTHLLTGCAARRLHARTAAEPCELDAGVLAEHPGIRGSDPATEHRLDARVVVVRLALLSGKLAGLEE